MKQKDILIIVIVVIIVGALSLILSNLLFGGNKAYTLKAPTVEVITADFKLPDSAYFNKESLDLTKNINIGGPGNPTPFIKTQ